MPAALRVGRGDQILAVCRHLESGDHPPDRDAVSAIDAHPDRRTVRVRCDIARGVLLAVQGQGAGRAAHDAIVAAIEQVIKSGPRTPDLGGQASTQQVGKAIAATITKG